MRSWTGVFGCAAIGILVAAGCGKGDKSSAERDAEIKKTLQEGAQREQKMYEGMQKGMEHMEKSMEEQKEKAKK
jgi:hypothetical protein